MNEVLVAGHICLDVIPAFGSKVTFAPGRLVEVGDAAISTGGAVSNTGLALHKLGIETVLCGKIGDDLFGRAACQVLDGCGEGLSRGMIVSAKEATSYTIVINLTGEDRMFLHAPGCNATFVSSDVSDKALIGAKLLHFGYPTLMSRMFEDDGRELLALFRRAKEQGITTSLDMSLPDLAGEAGKADWLKILTRVLPYTDLFLPSIDELLFMLDRQMFVDRGANSLTTEEFARLAGFAIDLGAKVLGVKAGSRGLYLRTAKDLDGIGRAVPKNVNRWQGVEIWGPTFQIEVKGTTGAGDATIAGLLMGWLRGMSPGQAVQAASAVGACCCEQADAVTGVRSWTETEQRIQSGWSTSPLDLGPNWDLKDGVYYRA